MNSIIIDIISLIVALIMIALVWWHDKRTVDKKKFEFTESETDLLFSILDRLSDGHITREEAIEEFYELYKPYITNEDTK